VKAGIGRNSIHDETLLNALFAIPFCIIKYFPHGEAQLGICAFKIAAGGGKALLSPGG
jgi:hypothetical protein